MEKTKVRIVWNGTGGELDSVTVEGKGTPGFGLDNTVTVRKALVKLIGTGIVNPGDSFTVEEVK